MKCGRDETDGRKSPPSPPTEWRRAALPATSMAPHPFILFLFLS